VKDIEVDT